MSDPDEVKVYQDQAEVEADLALEKDVEEQKLPAVTPGKPSIFQPGGLDVERVSELVHMDDNKKVTAQGAIAGLGAIGASKLTAKLINNGKPLSPGWSAIANGLGAGAGGFLGGILFGRKKK